MRAKALFESLQQNVRALSSLDESELQSFAGVFIPGGHAPLVDLWCDPHVSRVLSFFHSQRRPIGKFLSCASLYWWLTRALCLCTHAGSICHGPAALLAAKNESGQWLFSGYRMTAYSNREETMNELMWWDKVPLHVEDKLRESGAVLSNSWLPGMSNVVVDRELITGQGPTSAGKFAGAFLNALEHGVGSY